ncbi:MAG: hypothetical protein H6744_05505 [Deltaproteobacteria bacterium]|nr:hypothetical protein [Deltaproteobacteria bacterium]MCB9786135.1 hypothetical protein [Deltaproteobacteria bacterium]
MGRRLALGALTLALGLLAACDDGKCKEGESQTCTCANGNTGERTCRADGSLAACVCVTDTSTPDVFVPDSGCVPECGGWVCGDDGCGGSCGECNPGYDCTYGLCTLCPSGSGTCCDYRYTEPQTGLKKIGEACESDRECEYQVCLKPGDGGNETNSVFGFCTRGCDCKGGSEGQLTPAEEALYVCALVPGNKGGWRHVAVRCNKPEDCAAVDPGWTDCQLVDGATEKVCVAR